MLVFKTKKTLQDWLLKTDFFRLSKTIGFVPTMGALHQGHISLVKQSLLENDLTVVSLFVNPTQFNNKKDFDKYPKTIEEDTNLLKEANCDILYIPDLEDIYPNLDMTISSYTFSGIEKVMEGEFRPGHFNGVATVVKKLFNNVMPTNAYFGEKDYQQLLIIKELVEIEKLPIRIIGMPIFREEDGLAMSSRNIRLTKEFRKEAPLIFKTLQHVKNWTKEGRFLREIIDEVKQIFWESKLKLEYFEVRENNSLKLVDELTENNKHYRAFISVYAGEIRLIDNIQLL